MDKQQRTTRNNNKRTPNCFRLKHKRRERQTNSNEKTAEGEDSRSLDPIDKEKTKQASPTVNSIQENFQFRLKTMITSMCSYGTKETIEYKERTIVGAQRTNFRDSARMERVKRFKKTNSAVSAHRNFIF